MPGVCAHSDELLPAFEVADLGRREEGAKHAVGPHLDVIEVGRRTSQRRLSDGNRSFRLWLFLLCLECRRVDKLERRLSHLLDATIRESHRRDLLAVRLQTLLEEALHG